MRPIGWGAYCVFNVDGLHFTNMSKEGFIDWIGLGGLNLTGR